MFNYLFEKWEDGLKIGRSKEHHYLDTQRIQLLNAFAIISIITGLLIFTLYSILEFSNKYMSLLLIPISILILYLNKNYKSKISKDVAFYGFYFLILFWSFHTRRTGTILLLMIICCSAAFIYKKKSTIYFRIILCALGFVFYVLYDLNTPFYLDATINYTVITTLITIITCGVLLFIIMLSVDLIKHSSKSLSNSIEELNFANENLKNKENQLVTKNDELVVFNTMLDSMVKNSTKELQSYQKAIDDNLYSVVTDLEGRILKINEPYLKIIKYTEQELIGEKFSILYSDFHPKSYYEEIKNTVFSGKVWRGETKNKAKDGTHFWIVSSILPIIDENGEISKFFTISTNISDKKKAEDEQKTAFENSLKTNKRLNLVLDNQSDLVVITNKFAVRKYVNIAYCNFYGKEKQHFIGTSYKTLDPEKTSQSYTGLFESLSRSNPKITYLDVQENSLGEKRWIVWNELAVFNSEDEITEVFSFGHDITELKEIEFQNANYIAQFEEMAFKTSHIFRGPLTNIIGLMTLLEEDAIQEDEVKQVGVFMKSAVNKLDFASRDLVSFIDKYNTEKTNNIKKHFIVDFTLAKSKHLKWKYKIRNFLDGDGSLTMQQAISHLDCDLGKWYYSEGKTKYGHIESMQNFEIEHIQLHKLVKEILELKTNNEIEKSELKYIELIDSSDKIILLLDESESIINKNIN